MPLNPYFTAATGTQGSLDEQTVLADLVEESIQIHGQEFLYVPRELVAKDEILGEDRLSHFKYAYPIEMYVETNTAFGGQGEFISKFGLYVEQSIQVSVARRRWMELVGSTGKTILPTRPAEGDLVYSPLFKRLFEIKYVEKDTNFWQLGSLPMYKMTLELFQYASERLDTGVPDIDAFESLKSFDETILKSTPDAYGKVGVEAPDSFGDNLRFKAEAKTNTLVFDPTNPFGD